MNEQLSGPMLAPKEGKAKRLVVLLHGYGSDGNDLISLGQYWQPQMPDTLFVAPNAPQKCQLNPAGFQWFPLEIDKEMSRLKGADTARPVIDGFLESLWAQTELGAADTFLVGFSQGGMMALNVGLRLKENLLGIVSFSGGLIGKNEGMEGVIATPPICLVHGTGDEVVPVSLSKNSLKNLKENGYRVAMHLDPGGGHGISAEGLGFSLAFMREVADLKKGD
ncbi:MAG: prolyl oligopeptidase family serine peptidase [Devosiaceae bacterium]|nr:prolyl oligopeptidase family serine peptidase [Devosiaceae bacterium]